MDKRKSVLNTDRYDRRRFGQILEMSDRLQEINQKGKEVIPTFSPLMSDIWASLYKVKPSLLEEQDFDQEFKINYYFMKKMMNEESYHHSHKTTRLDDLSAALGTVSYSEKVYEWVDEQRSVNEELQKAIQEALQSEKSLCKAENMQQEAQDSLDVANQNSDKKAQESAKRKITKAKKQMKVAQENFENAVQQIQSQLTQSIEQNKKQFSERMSLATDKAKQSKEDLINLLAGGAGNGESELQKLPLRDQIKLAELLSKNGKLKEIAEWAGRFKAIARKKQKTKHVETIDRSGVTLGIDVERLLPVELAAYKNSSTKLDFLRRYAEHQTMMYAPEGKETLGKGPIILCLDQSGSMKKLDAQSKGFALALMMIAKKQRRDFAIIPFSNSTKQGTFRYDKGKIKPGDLVKLAETFLGGGTNYTSPLQKAVSIIEENSRYRKADVVFITDGEPSDHHALRTYTNPQSGVFTKIKKERQFSVTTILIGNDVTDNNVKSFSDKIVRASDFNNDTVASVAFTI